MIATREWVKDLMSKVLKKNNEEINETLIKIMEHIKYNPNSISLIPIMTSNTSSNGIASTNCAYSSGYDNWPTTFNGEDYAYKVFDGKTNDDGLTEYSDDNVEKYVQYDFTSNVIVNNIEVSYRTSTLNTNIYFDYYDIENSTWIEFFSKNVFSPSAIDVVSSSYEYIKTNKIRIRTGGGKSNTRLVICDIKVYGSYI